MEEEERKLSYKLVTGRLLLLKNQPCSEGRCERRYKEQVNKVQRSWFQPV